LINSNPTSVISGCKFASNSASVRGGAIATYNFRLVIENCLFNQNTSVTEGGAVSITNAHPTAILGCTFYKNSSANGGGVASTGASPVTVDQSIIASSLSGGGAHVDVTSTLTFGCTDMHGNAGGDWVGAFAAQLGTNGNLSADPLFCSPGSGNFFLHEGSPCTPGNHPDGDDCGIIGLLGAGCGTVGIEHQTWGVIKTLFSE